MNSITLLRRLILLYFLLLIFEGALRFWVFPSLNSVLLIVRDPVVLAIYAVAGGSGLIPRNAAIGVTVLLAIFSVITSFGNSDVPLTVILFGLRANYLHLPLIFVMPMVMNRDDVLRIGKWSLILMIPMAVLVVKQFQSPPGSLINKGGYLTQQGTVRPAGTFSFVSGMVAFSALVAAYLAYSLGRKLPGVPAWLKVACGVAVLASLGVSGSRATIAAVATIFVMLAGLSLTSAVAARSFITMLGIAGLSFAGLSSTEFFQEGKGQLASRFSEASHGDFAGDAESRFVDIFSAPFQAADSVPLFGYGLGLGTNAGAYLATGRHTFIGYETEWGRCVFETGPLLGGAFILLRIGITLQLLLAGIGAFKRGNLLSILLFGATATNMAFGQWGVPTNQGFACFVGGLCLAAARFAESEDQAEAKKPATPWWLVTPTSSQWSSPAKMNVN